MFFLSLFSAFAYMCLSALICLPWAQDISWFLGAPIAWYLVAFIAIIPGFVYVFTLVSLLTHRVNLPKKQKSALPPVTVIIPAFNAKDSVCQTVQSILDQQYEADVRIICVDDGSTDNTADVLLADFGGRREVQLLRLLHQGKAGAMNAALRLVYTDYFLTVDSDTILHKFALRSIIQRIVSGRYAAVAGFLMPSNGSATFITQLQCWEYFIGIFSIKLLQGFYQSTLVAQGAFSAYETKAVIDAGGWKDCVGEDIVLTWTLLARGHKTSFECTAVALTGVPEKLEALRRQRKRWARGMIQGFRMNRGILRAKRANLKSRILIAMNLLFPFADLAACIFYPLAAILALVFHNFLLIGLLTVLLLPLTLFQTAVAQIKLTGVFRHANRQLSDELGLRRAIFYEFDPKSIFAFIIYILFFQLLLAPASFAGYLKETLYEERRW